MEVTPLPDQLADLIPDWQYTYDPAASARTGTVERRVEGRTAGLHVSGIIKHILAGLEPDRFARPTSPDPAQAARDEAAFNARIRVGLLFEDILSQALAARRHRLAPERYLRPGEQCSDLGGGHLLYGTPDIVDILDDCVEEWKATWLSLKWVKHPNNIADSRKLWHYIVQLKTYCHMCHMDRGRLRVLFINGDYKYDSSPDGGPQFRGWEFKFTPAELRDNWRMITSHGLQLAARRKAT